MCIFTDPLINPYQTLLIITLREWVIIPSFHQKTNIFWNNCTDIQENVSV